MKLNDRKTVIRNPYIILKSIFILFLLTLHYIQYSLAHNLIGGEI